MIQKRCPVDRRPFSVYPSRCDQRFCSRACRRSWFQSQIYRKKCARESCQGEVVRRNLNKFDKAKYCSRFCRNHDAHSAKNQAKRNRAVMDSCRVILDALDIQAEPTLELANAVRQIRLRGYHAGWRCAKHKFQRAIERGVLVRREAA